MIAWLANEESPGQCACKMSVEPVNPEGARPDPFELGEFAPVGMLLGPLLKRDELMKRMFSIKSMLLAATLSLVGTASSSADTFIFLKMDNIIGTSQYVGYVGDVILSGFSANIAANTAGTSPSSVGPPAQRAAAPVCGRFTITKNVDPTSTRFIQLVLTGQPSNASLIFTKQNPDGFVDFVRIDLQEAVVNSITQNEPLPDAATFTETIVLQATRFQYTQSGGFRAGFDCITNTAF